jgi:hypothetical protein
MSELADAAGADNGVAGVIDAVQQLHDAAALLIEGNDVVELVPNLHTMRRHQ